MLDFRCVRQLLLIFGMFMPSVALSAQASSVLDTWRGTVTQEDGQTYSLAMKIERLELQGYAGTTTYSGSVNCTGLLTFRRQRAGLYEFDETINGGSSHCINGRIEWYITNDGLMQWEWYEKGRGGDPAAKATLSRKP